MKGIRNLYRRIFLCAVIMGAAAVSADTVHLEVDDSEFYSKEHNGKNFEDEQRDAMTEYNEKLEEWKKKTNPNEAVPKPPVEDRPEINMWESVAVPLYEDPGLETVSGSSIRDSELASGQDASKKNDNEYYLNFDNKYIEATSDLKSMVNAYKRNLQTTLDGLNGGAPTTVLFVYERSVSLLQGRKLLRDDPYTYKCVATIVAHLPNQAEATAQPGNVKLSEGQNCVSFESPEKTVSVKVTRGDKDGLTADKDFWEDQKKKNEKNVKAFHEFWDKNYDKDGNLRRPEDENVESSVNTNIAGELVRDLFSYARSTYYDPDYYVPVYVFMNEERTDVRRVNIYKNKGYYYYRDDGSRVYETLPPRVVLLPEWPDDEPKPEGKELIGYKLEDTPDARIYKPGETFVLLPDPMYVYTVWGVPAPAAEEPQEKAPCTIKLRKSGGSSEVTDTTHKVGDTYWTLKQAFNQLVDHWSISAGTCKDKNGNELGVGASLKADERITLTGDLTLTASLLTTYTVTFDPNGGTGTTRKELYAEGAEITLASCSYTRSGCQFDGWLVNGRLMWPGDTFKVTGNMTVRPNWSNKVSVQYARITGLGDQYYTGSPIRPEPVVTVGIYPNAQELVKDRDYTVTYENNIAPGVNTATVIITGKGNYCGVCKASFSIVRNLADVAYIKLTEYYYNDPSVEVRLKEDDTLLKAGQDYTVVKVDGTFKKLTYDPSMHIKASVKGINTYAGSLTTDFYGSETCPYNIKAEQTEDNTGIKVTWDYDGDANTKFLIRRIRPLWAVYTDPGFGLVAVGRDHFFVDKNVQKGETYKYYVYAADQNGNINTEPSASYNVKYVGDGVVSLNTYYNISLDLSAEPYVSLTGTEKFEPPVLSVMDSYGNRVRASEFAKLGITVRYENNDRPGVASVVIEGDGTHYSGGCCEEFFIYSTDFGSGEYVADEIDGQSYTGSAITPECNVYFQGNYINKLYALKRDEDYTISYENNVETGIASAVIRGIGNYTGEFRKNFVIYNDESPYYKMSETHAEVYGTFWHYPGTSQCPSSSQLYIGALGYGTLQEGIDYRIVGYENNDAPGTAYIIVQGIGKFVGTIKVRFEIRRQDQGDISKAYVELNEYGTVYDGQVHRPVVTRVVMGATTLKEGTDYTVSGSTNYIKAGSYSVKVTGKGKYSGTASRDYKIARKDISGAHVKYLGSLTNPGKSGLREAAVEVTLDGTTLQNQTDYVAYYYKSSTDLHTNRLGETVIVWGEGNYSGEVFIYHNCDIGRADVKIPDHTYTGDPITLGEDDVKVLFDESYFGERHLLKYGKDYTLTNYRNNVDAGTATVTLTGTGWSGGEAFKGICGQKEITFNILPRDLSGASVTVSGDPDYTAEYTGSAIQPAPTVQVNGMILTPDTDYSVSYENNVKGGTALIRIEGKGNYTGSALGTFKIHQDTRDIQVATVSGVAERYTYTGEAIWPVPTVKDGNRTLVYGTDYLLAYRSCVNPGTGIVIISARGSKYTGVKKIYFEIDPADISSAEISGVEESYKYTGLGIRPVPTVVVDDKTLTRDTDYSVSYSNNVNVGTATVTIRAIIREPYRQASRFIRTRPLRPGRISMIPLSRSAESQRDIRSPEKRSCLNRS